MADYSHVIILANGDLLDGEAVRRIIQKPAIVIAADGGAKHAPALNLTISLLVGDMDSISEAMLASLSQHACEILRFPPEKDQTDLEIALLEAIRRDAQQISVIGAVGGRLDQTLGNIYLMNLPELDHCDVRLVASDQTTFVLMDGEHNLMGNIGDTISLIPLDGDVFGVTTHDLQYPLDHETLEFGPARGISNVIIGNHPQVSIESGRLLVVHTIGRA